MRRFLYWCAVSVIIFTLTGAATAGEKKEGASPSKESREEEEKSPRKRSYEKSNIVKIRATVAAIDHATRMVTLRKKDGSTITFAADKRIKNLPQVKVGDTVTAQYHESIAVEVKKPGEVPLGKTTTEALVTADPGEKPKGVATKQVTITATVEALDVKKPSVMLKGPEGKSVEVRIKDPKKIENVRVGDQVVITYTEALAISVQKEGD